MKSLLALLSLMLQQNCEVGAFQFFQSGLNFRTTTSASAFHRTRHLHAAQPPAPTEASNSNGPSSSSGPSSDASSEAPSVMLHDTEGYRETLLRLAKWSLEDYEWRSSVFKSNEADRMVEETMARMQGKDPSYLRPMDAAEGKIGPLGMWEKSAVEWLSNVIDEEGRRAKQIIALDGKLIRPIEADQLGPLGKLEKQVVDFVLSIKSSERERARTQTLRPKDLEESLRGPLGRAEEAVTRFFAEIRDSEFLRLQQSQSRGGAMVRPIDVPGPLGELEMVVADILKAEEMRAAELTKSDDKLLRPKDAKIKGPLGEAEEKTFEFLDRLSAEEMERLRNMEQYLKDSRPMESNRDSVLGVVEAVVVGIIRAPLLIVGVIGRVRELIGSFDNQPLSDQDQRRISDSGEKSKFQSNNNNQ